MNPNQIVFSHAGFARLSAIAAAAAAGFRALSETLVKMQRGWAAARARRELHQLSDRTLKDIGLSREQIDALFR